MPYVSAFDRDAAPHRRRPQARPANKEGEQGRRRINQLTRYGTVLLAIVQSLFIAQYVESLSGSGHDVVVDPGWGFRLMTIITLTTARRSSCGSVSRSPIEASARLLDDHLRRHRRGHADALTQLDRSQGLPAG